LPTILTIRVPSTIRRTSAAPAMPATRARQHSSSAASGRKGGAVRISSAPPRATVVQPHSRDRELAYGGGLGTHRSLYA
jgi:hypothetical protein